MSGVKKILGYLAFIAICILIINNVLFTHFHHLESGHIIVHAHPYNKASESSDKNSQHQHKEKEFFIISILNSVLFKILIVSVFLFLFFLNTSGFQLNYKIPLNNVLTIQTNNIRPPPILI